MLVVFCRCVGETRLLGLVCCAVVVLRGLGRLPAGGGYASSGFSSQKCELALRVSSLAVGLFWQL